MFKKRKIIALIILLSGCVGAFLIMRTPASKNNEQIVTGVSLGKNENDFRFSQKSGSNNNAFVVSANTDGAVIQPENTNNFTDNLAYALAQEVAQNNADAIKTHADPKSLQMPSDDVVTSAINAQGQKDFKVTTFNVRDIRVTEDNSSVKQLAYLNDLNEASKKSFKNFDEPLSKILEEYINNQNNAPLQKYVGLIPGQISNLLAVSVPSQWAQFHLQNLNLWQKKLAVYSALLDIEGDPLKSMVAIGKISEVVDETMSLDKVMRERVGELKNS